MIDPGFKKYIRDVLIIDLVLLISIALPFYVMMPVEYALSVVASLALTSTSSIVGFYFQNKYLHAPTEEFVSYVYGSMFFRLVGLLGAIVFILLITNFPQISFILSLFISYLCKSVLEIIFIHKKSTQRHEKS
ncbi:MAG TPA: hypothetical protein DCE78_06145 [Bacteroidetes bacterium]|nr:hypothetical protein [Bacteroidota bacterium]